MKKILIFLIHLGLTIATSGLWLIGYLTYIGVKSTSNDQSSNTTTYAMESEINVGDYIQNKGRTGKWIGRVIDTDCFRYEAKVTWCDTHAFEKGKVYTFLQDEIQPVKNVCFKAATQGWK
jgi:hypothetical protein